MTLSTDSWLKRRSYSSGDFVDQAHAVVARRGEDDEQLGALFQNVSLRVTPLAASVEDGQPVGKARGHDVFEKGVPGRVVHDLTVLIAATHEELVLDKPVGLIRTGKRASV